MRSSAPAGKLGRVGDPLLESVGAECAEADRRCSVERSDAPVRGGSAAAHSAWDLDSPYDEGCCLVLGVRHQAGGGCAGKLSMRSWDEVDGGLRRAGNSAASKSGSPVETLEQRRVEDSASGDNPCTTGLLWSWIRATRTSTHHI